MGNTRCSKIKKLTRGQLEERALVLLENREAFMQMTYAPTSISARARAWKGARTVSDRDDVKARDQIHERTRSPQNR